jgi:hypothetical protein
MSRWVEIEFTCLPLRSVGRLDVPMDASPKYRQFCERIKAALERHGSHNTYYLYNAQCVFHFTNSPDAGTVAFRFEGTVLTNAEDLRTERCDLDVSLARETCDWLTQPIVDWLAETVSRSVQVEFDRYIAAGDLEQAKRRIAEIQAKSDEAEGYLGMYL